MPPKKGQTRFYASRSSVLCRPNSFRESIIYRQNFKQSNLWSIKSYLGGCDCKDNSTKVYLTPQRSGCNYAVVGALVRKRTSKQMMHISMLLDCIRSRDRHETGSRCDLPDPDSDPESWKFYLTVIFPYWDFSCDSVPTFCVFRIPILDFWFRMGIFYGGFSTTHNRMV